MNKRILCLVLALALLLPALLGRAPQVRADKAEPKRAIAVVFDNSGSMYAKGNEKAWCRATYATEVFASMLNQGDVMQIHPMNPAYLNTEGSGQAYVYGSNPLVINGPEEAQKIRDLFLIANQGASTPIESIGAAYDALSKLQADEKYLVVLTDGATFYENDVEMSDSQTLQALNQTLGSIRDCYVMYLGMGPANKPAGEDATHYYTTAKDTQNVLSELTKMSNIIFGRDVLPNVTTGASVDVSMKKLIVFAQGKNADEVTLGSNSRTAQVKVVPSQRGIDTTGMLSSYYQWIPDYGVPDNDLGGVLATFENVPIGDHSLTVAGGYDNVEIYYEPDVELRLQFTDAQGNPVDPNECYAEQYTLSWYLVDGQTGQKTTSSLLKDPKYDINLTITHADGSSQTIDADQQGDQIQLDLLAGDQLSGTFQVTYLERYTSESSMEDLGWGANGLTITPRPVGDLKLELTGGGSTYPLSQFQDQAVYQVALYCQGQQVTGGDLERAELSCTLTGGNAQCGQPQKTETGWTVALAYNGQAVDTSCGSYTLQLQAGYTNIDGQSATVAASTTFTLEDDSHGLKAELLVEEDYYVLSSLDSAPPVYVKLTSEAMPMDSQMFATTQVKVTIDGLTEGQHFTVTPEGENSRYAIRFLPDSGIDATDYTIRVRATGKDQIGRDIASEASAQVGFNTMPLWAKILLWVLLAILLIVLICIWRNTKRLPKDVKILEGMSFVVDGETVPGDTSPKKHGFGKSKGHMTITAPDYMLVPMAASACGFTLMLEAKSPRKVKSASRSAWVVGIRVADPMATETLLIGTESFMVDKDTMKVYSAMGGPEEPIRFDIGGTTSFVVMSEIPSPSGRGTVSCTLTGEFEFR